MAVSIKTYDFSLVATGVAAALMVGLLSLLAVTPYGSALARIQCGARKPTQEEYNYLKPLFDEVYKKSGMKQKIRLYISKDNYPNGGALGVDTIMVSVPLLHCSPEEIKAVIAHELGHINNYDTRIHSICCIVDSLGIVALSVAIAALTLLTDTFKIFFPFLVFVVLLKLAQVILNLFVKFTYLSAQRGMELKADAFAAKLGYREGMVKFLNRVGDKRKTAIFDTHPLSKKRIADLTA